MSKLITLDNLQRFKDKADTKYAKSSHTHSTSDIEFPEGTTGDVLKKTDDGVEWGQAASPIVFNTAYDESTNKAATMSDITSATSGMLTTSSTLDASKVSGILPSTTYTDTTYVFNTAYDATTNKAATMADVAASSSSYEFNTAYDATTNKAATMADINNAIGDINTLLDEIIGS